MRVARAWVVRVRVLRVRVVRVRVLRVRVLRVRVVRVGRCTRPGPPFFSIKKGCGECSYDSMNPACQLFANCSNYPVVLGALRV